MKILIIGGSFDDNGGRPSSLVDKFYYALGDASKNLSEKIEVSKVNGGHFDEIEDLLKETAHADVVLWWANVPNDKPKIRNVKEINPKCMLVTSKRNDNEKYSFGELVNRALGAKANLCVEFSKQNDGIFQMMLFDPLGNCWYKGNSINECAENMANRLQFLKSVTRQGCIKDEKEVLPIPEENSFFDLVRKNADIFHELINPAPNVTRFLGNSSFRCQRGFPSFKDDKIIYVSQRNVDKRYIDKNAFVPAYLKDGQVFYQGDNKPSVDTPIQLRLYKELPNIKYMIHAHVYVENAPFTERMIPCGGLEEVEEVISTLKNEYGRLDKDFYAINLIGHGSIVMANDVEKMKDIHYIGRTLPEKRNNDVEYIKYEDLERD